MAKFVHLRIKNVAMEMAGEFYEEVAHDDLFYKMYPEVNFFIKREWPRFIKPARTILAQMLAGNYPEKMKEEIFDALRKDRSLPQGQDTAIPVSLH